MTHADHPGFLTQPQDLNKQALEGVEVAEPKFSDSAVIGLPVSAQHPEGQVLVAGPLDLAGGDDAYAIGVEQQHCQPLRGWLLLHPRNKPFLPSRILGLGRDQDLGEIQFIHQGRAGNTPDGLRPANHAVTAAAGWSAPAARDGMTWASA